MYEKRTGKRPLHSDRLENDFRARLRRGDRLVGIHITHLGGPETFASLSRLPLDFAFIDTEHVPLDRSEAASMCRFYAAKNISPTVRIPYPDGHLASMAVDGGAEGIVVPYVETEAEVKEIVGAVKYRPLKGERLRAFLDRKESLDERTRAYLDERNQHTYILIGIESVPACRNLEALTRIEGIDGLFIGPHDLTVSMGIPEEYHHPDYLHTVKRIIQTGRAAGIGVGMHMKKENVSRQTIRDFLEAGMNWLLWSTDLETASEALTREIQSLLGFS